MQLFNTKKPAADTAALDAAEEHKQSIGDQVMEALGVGDGAEERMHPEEDTEIMMPKKNQSQLAAEEMMKQHESICVISPDAVIKGGIEVKDAVMVAGRVMGDIVAAIMDDNGTPDSVLDDKIASVRYAGWAGLFEEICDN